MRKKIIMKHKDRETYKSISRLLTEPKITLASVVKKEQVHNITTNLNRKSSPTTRTKPKLIRQAAAIPSIGLENL